VRQAEEPCEDVLLPHDVPFHDGDVILLVLVVLEGDYLELAVGGGEVGYADDPQAEVFRAALTVPMEGARVIVLRV
jgi:hypothetical protein